MTQPGVPPAVFAGRIKTLEGNIIVAITRSLLVVVNKWCENCHCDMMGLAWLKVSTRGRLFCIIQLVERIRCKDILFTFFITWSAGLVRYVTLRYVH